LSPGQHGDAATGWPTRTGGLSGLNVQPGQWTLRIWREIATAAGPRRQRLSPGDLHELVLVFHYTVSATS
jgi:hypothetical protein